MLAVHPRISKEINMVFTSLSVMGAVFTVASLYTFLSALGEYFQVVYKSNTYAVFC